MTFLKHKAHPELIFERKNRKLQRLPKYARVEKRPIPHPPVASPYAGSKVAKIVYVSTKTPFMSAVKRVQKLLREVEKRAVAKVDLHDRKVSEKEKVAQLKESTQALQKEEVFIKATGRAIQKAMDIGKWFNEKEGYNIKVKTGTVLVVDDIIEDDGLKEKESRKREKREQPKAQTEDNDKREVDPLAQHAQIMSEASAASTTPKAKPQKNKNKRKLLIEEDELPESRTRWVNMVEIAVTFK
ncbi:AlbA family DNA/RNA-binding protein [Emydomyces testavorans]|uniref:AlbA family DNA/RNA-binding protein n=1 Tax=Emydomyces testavorans TaxID=2070801 RepID=A0AAF0IKH9_9EURO|nr:AlbA family DNA/RNA-binding protein [Emydomyces testavorans]